MRHTIYASLLNVVFAYVVVTDMYFVCLLFRGRPTKPSLRMQLQKLTHSVSYWIQRLCCLLNWDITVTSDFQVYINVMQSWCMFLWNIGLGQQVHRQWNIGLGQQVLWQTSLLTNSCMYLTFCVCRFPDIHPGGLERAASCCDHHSLRPWRHCRWIQRSLVMISYQS